MTTDRKLNTSPVGAGRGWGAGPRNRPCDRGKDPEEASGGLRKREEVRCEMRPPRGKMQKGDGQL